MKQWYVVYTKTNGEQQAAVNLSNQGFEVYLPRYRKTRRHARRIEKIMRPLFPRYLFVRMGLNADDWRSVNGTRGVMHLVVFGETPPAVPELVMESLRERETADGAILLVNPETERGKSVGIASNAFDDVTGVFECMVDDQRAMILLNLLGQTVRVTTPLRSLVPAL